jgi:RNA polymerase sigma-70 factor (ECF subfamily)
MRSDEALLEAVRAKDLAAFDELYARHERALFGFIQAHLKDQAESEDVLHETFVAVLTVSRVDVQTVRAWLFSIARNACLNRLRARRHRAAVTLPPTEPQPGAHEVLEQHQQKVALASAVAALPDEQQQLFHLRAKGLSYGELADVLAVPLGTIKSRLHELVRRLRQSLDQ